MLTDRSFVLTVPAEPDELCALRAELILRLPEAHLLDDDVLLVASLLVRQAQNWRGAYGPVRLRTSTLGQVVHFEVLRDVELDGDAGPVCTDAFHALLELLAERTERFTVSTFPGSVSLAAQKIVAPLPHEAEIDLRVAA
jgi:hypothetical protein